jgi:hypothetical protein
MCCGNRGHHGSRGHSRSHSCCGHASSHCGQRFYTKEEQIAQLEQIHAELQQEATAVQEHISALRERT